MNEALRAIARDTKGFMPEDEGLALHDAGLDGGSLGPIVEIGSYCGKSTVYLGTAARANGTVVFAVDHHRGSEENQAGWQHHDPEVVDAGTGRMDTLPFLRRTLERADLEEVVVAVVGDSPTIARHWRTGLGMLFIDGGHALDVAMADYDAWARYLLPGALLAIHDVFEDPADGGQAPFEVWQRAVADDFAPESAVGSLRILRR